VAYLIAFVLLADSVGRVGVKKVLTMTTRADEPGPTVAAAVVIILAGAVTAAALGMEPIFGAFIAGTGLRLGVINTTTYTIVVLVALVTSTMAPPVLRHAMSRITQTDEELVRKIDHDTWDGDERVQRAA